MSRVLMRLGYPWLRSRNFASSVALCSVVAVAGVVAEDMTLRLPFVHRSLPVPLVVVFVAALAVATPLPDRFGGLERSMVRERLDRVLAGAVACGLALMSCVPGALAAGARFPWSLLLALMLVAVLSAVAVGPLAWLPPLVVGLVAIYVDLLYQDAARHALDSVGLPVLTVALLLGLTLFVLRGPRPA